VLKHRFAACSTPPDLTDGNSVQQNTQAAEDLAKMNGPPDKYLYDQFHTGGPQDYKNQLPMGSSQDQKDQMADAGNFNYGATCTAAGHSLQYCQSAAGVAAIAGGVANLLRHGNGQFGGVGTPFAYPPFGDQPHDSEQIAKGSSQYQACHGVNGN